MTTFPLFPLPTPPSPLSSVRSPTHPLVTIPGRSDHLRNLHRRGAQLRGLPRPPLPSTAAPHAPPTRPPTRRQLPDVVRDMLLGLLGGLLRVARGPAGPHLLCRRAPADMAQVLHCLVPGPFGEKRKGRAKRIPSFPYPRAHVRTRHPSSHSLRGSFTACANAPEGISQRGRRGIDDERASHLALASSPA